MPGALENKAGAAADQPPDFSAALRAFREGQLGDGLVMIKLLAAGLTFVFESRHKQPHFLINLNYLPNGS